MAKQIASWGIGVILLECSLKLEQIKAGIESSSYVSSMRPGPGNKLARQ